MYQHQGPVLDVCWNKVRNRLVSVAPKIALTYLALGGKQDFLWWGR